MAVFVRAINLLKASRTLLAEGHWEVAASVARQLFEILVNVEYLLKQPDPSAERLRYTRFGMLQLLLSRLRELDYQRNTGRPTDETDVTTIQSLLVASSFDDFRTRDGKWKRSWSGKTTRALAESSHVALRRPQYEQLFATWSEESHAAPIALLEDILPKDMDGWVEREVSKDDHEIAQMALMLVAHFLEIWEMLPGAPTLDPERAYSWTTPLHDLLVAHAAGKPDLR